jgi:hypothetical protein
MKRDNADDGPELEALASWFLGVEPPPQGFDASKYPKNLGLIAMARVMVNGGVIQGSLVDPVYALIRRLNLVGIGRSIRRPIQWYGG